MAAVLRLAIFSSALIGLGFAAVLDGAEAECDGDSCMAVSHLQLVHDVQGVAETEHVGAPDASEQDDVNAVWTNMRALGGPSMGAADINMFMKSNTMTMDVVEFTFNGNLPPGSLVETGANQKLRPPPPPPPSPPQPDQSMQFNFGPLALGMYMTDDSMSMIDATLNTNGNSQHSDETTIASLAQVSSAIPQKQMYMYNDELSMDTTIFTMNVGAGASLLQQGESSAMSLGTLNINMYMYGNSMKMTDATFTMDVNSLPMSSISMQSAGVSGGQLARLLLLTTSVAGSASSDQSVSSSSSTGEDVTSVWDWLKSWSAQSQDTSTVDIDMHMYDNHISMENTEFAMNVGSGAGSLLSSSVETTSNSSNSQGSKSSVKDDMYMYDTAMSMKDTTFTISVASLLQESGEKAPSPGEKITMNMYKNTMKMTDTIFTMNVGTASLLQSSASRHAQEERFKNAKREVMNVGKLNVNMYMYKNDMEMENTVFTWTVR